MYMLSNRNARDNKASVGMFQRTLFLTFLFRTEDTVSGIAETRDNITDVIELFINAAAVNFDVRVVLL